MDERQRAQIELILSHEMDLALRAANNESGKIFAANAAKGLLQGGATVKQIIRAIGTQTEELLETVVAKASAVSKASGVSTLIEAAFQAHFENLDKPVFEAARIASGRAMPEPQSSVLKAARDLLEVVRADIGAKLAIARFNFDGGLAPSLPANSPSNMNPRNTGGKPLAAHWDDMWSSLAVQLWKGDFEPKRQADVTAAMHEWLAARGIETGATAVVERARQLWRKIEQSH